MNELHFRQFLGHALISKLNSEIYWICSWMKLQRCLSHSILPLLAWLASFKIYLIFHMTFLLDPIKWSTVGSLNGVAAISLLFYSCSWNVFYCFPQVCRFRGHYMLLGQINAILLPLLINLLLWDFLCGQDSSTGSTAPKPFLRQCTLDNNPKFQRELCVGI